MAGRGSLAGLLAYGNANEIVCEMAREVLPVVKHTPVLAGVNGTDPFMITDQFLRRIIDLGFSGIQNFPTVGLIDGTFRANLEETGMGYGLEVELVAQAHALDLLTTPYVFSEAEARDMAARRCRHRRVPHGPDHRRLDRRRHRAEAGRLRGADQRLVRGGQGGEPARSSCCATAGRSPRPTDASYILKHCPGMPRLLRRQLDGAAAHRSGADRDDAPVHADCKVVRKTRRPP